MNRIKKCTSTFIIWALAANVSAECSVGDEKCMAMGMIKRCAEIYDNRAAAKAGLETEWAYTGKVCDAADHRASGSGRECTIGDQKCDAEGWVQECEYNSNGTSSQRTKWSAKIGHQCKR